MAEAAPRVSAIAVNEEQAVPNSARRLESHDPVGRRGFTTVAEGEGD
jgi:hypothetical protein